MNADQRTEVMLAVLDGSATAAQHVAFETLLATEPSARSEFDGWRRMFDALAQVPAVDPPEGMAAAISATIPQPRVAPREELARRGQPFSGRSVIEAGQASAWSLPDRLRTTFRRLGRPSTTEEFEQMKLNRKVWVGGGMAAVALGVALYVLGYPPSSENILGTIVPAERYRAPQASGEDIKVGGPSGGQAATAAGTVTAPAGQDAASMDRQQKLDAAALDRQQKLDASSMDRVQKLDATSMDRVQKLDASSMDRQQKLDASSMDRVQKLDATSMDRVQKLDASSMDRQQKLDASSLDRQKLDAASLDRQQKLDKASLDRQQKLDSAAR